MNRFLYHFVDIQICLIHYYSILAIIESRLLTTAIEILSLFPCYRDI